MKQCKIIILLLTLLATACGRGNNVEEGPLHDNSATSEATITAKANGSFRIVTYNVGAINKFISDNFTKEQNVNLIADIIREANADAVCFQELDSCNTRNNYFQLKTLSEAIDKSWQYHYAPAIEYRNGKYGTGVTVAHTGAKCYNIPIPTPAKSEDRVVAVMEYDDYVIASTHLNASQPDQIKIITAEIAKHYGNSSKPVFLGGDMNAQPSSEMMNEFRKNWIVLSNVNGTTVNDRTACIDYVLQFKNKAKIVTVTDSQVILNVKAGDTKIASDHYPVYVDVKL